MQAVLVERSLQNIAILVFLTSLVDAPDLHFCMVDAQSDLVIGIVVIRESTYFRQNKIDQIEAFLCSLRVSVKSALIKW